MKGFWNDRDGVSEKDYLLIAATTVFFLFLAVGLVLVLLGHQIDDAYLSLLNMASPVLMTVAGGMYGVRAVQEFRKQPENNPDEEVEDNRGTQYPI